MGAGGLLPAAWLSLDAADNDPARFLRYLAAQRAYAGDSKHAKQEHAMSHVDQQTRYTVILEGSADPSLVDWCGPVTIATDEAQDGASITRLTGIAVDQAGIVGIIRHLHGLGMVLLCVQRER